jgi:hypothetical protein
MYILQDKPIPYRYRDQGELSTPDATLIDDRSGQVFHIDQDDHCRVLVGMDTDSQTGRWVPHWFPEAVEALKTLPALS